MTRQVVNVTTLAQLRRCVGLHQSGGNVYREANGFKRYLEGKCKVILHLIGKVVRKGKNNEV